MLNITFDNLKALASQNPKLAVSIYLPLHKAGPENRQDPIYFENMINKAKQEALEKGFSDQEIEHVLEPLRTLRNNLEYWNGMGANGAAFFVSENFSTIVDSPETFNEEVTVNNRFNIKQLLKLLTGNSRYYILAISKNRVRFIECDRYNCNEIEVNNLPKSLEEALGVEISTKNLQFHTSGSPSESGRHGTTFHGQGGVKDDELDKNRRFINEVEKALYKNFLNDKNAPLIIAGAKEYLSMFQSTSSYKNIISKAIDGNYDNASNSELHERSMEIIKPYLEAEVKDHFQQYKSIRGTDNTSNELEVILPLAYQGRIDKLFIHSDMNVWGSFDKTEAKVAKHTEKSSSSEDLDELVVFYTIINGGRVYLLDPEKYELRNKIGALIRF